MQTRIATGLLVTLLAVAACGGGNASTPTGTAPAAGGTAPASAVSGAPAAPAAPMKALRATEHGKALSALGLDENNLPTMDKLQPEQLRKVMGLFTKSLGVDCKFCHKGGDFKAPTEHKKLAERMWNEWVHGVKLKTNGVESPMFCDSCHQGKAEFLDKSNHDELAKWMKTEFVDRMHMQKGETTCETCHGKPFDGDFLEKWEKL